MSVKGHHFNERTYHLIHAAWLFGGKAPQDVFGYLFGQEMMQIFGLEKIKPEEVVLKNTLLPGFTGPALAEIVNTLSQSN